MTHKLLGNSGLAIAPLVLGGNVFGWTIDQAASFPILDAFVDLGLNFIDTANVYSAWKPGNVGGESETIIGNWLKATGKRHRVLLATKVGMKMGDGTEGLKKENILASAEASLKRLQTDHIDLYQSHKDDASTPLDETLSAYETLIKQGKVRAIGASNYDAARLAEALTQSASKGLPAYTTLQPEYNLYARDGFETALEPLVLKQNIGVIPYFPLASGFLTGKYRTEADASKSPRGGNIVKKYLNPRGLKILAALDAVAAEQKSTPAAVALAWIIARPSITAPIASATAVSQLQELAKALHLKLTSSQIDSLTAASAA